MATAGLFFALLALAKPAIAQVPGGGLPQYGPAAAPNGASMQAYGGRPFIVRYEPGAPPPPGYHLDESPRKGLLVAGALTFGVPYLISLTVGGASRYEGDRWLLLPVVGPVGTLTYGMRECDRDRGLECAGNILIVVGLAFDLAAQTAGAILFTMGFVFPKKQWVSDYDVSRRTPPAFTWSIVPRVEGARHTGLTLVGSFF